MTHAMLRLSVLVPAVILTCASAVAAPPDRSGPSASSDRLGGMQLARKVFIRGGCPYNLDKECDRLPNGRLVHCRCVS